MIDNFEQIAKLLEFESEDDFYFLQILKRKKEHPELGSNSYVVKTYFIKSVNDLWIHKKEIIYLCEHHNARAGINLNRRSFEKVAFKTLQKVTEQLMNRDYKSVRTAYSSACGLSHNEKDKKWIVDIDHKNRRAINDLLRVIEAIPPTEQRFIALLETKNGFHLITKPFNLQIFKQNSPDIEIHKDNPCCLYVP